MLDARFVDISQRNNQSNLDSNIWTHIAQHSCYIDWRGVPLQKDPLQIVMTQQLIQELNPKTIIEFGSFKGGSALWLADMQQMANGKARVISIDLNMEHIVPHALLDDRIHFIQGDCNHIKQALPISLLVSLPHPVLVIEDAHVNTLGILDYLDRELLMPGDYFIIEDTNIDYNNACYFVWKNTLSEEACQNKLKALNQKLPDLTQWLNDNSPHYLIDTKYVDPFGIINGSKNWNSVIKCMSSRRSKTLMIP